MKRPPIEIYKSDYTKYIQDETRGILLNYIDFLESRLAGIAKILREQKYLSGKDHLMQKLAEGDE